MIIKRYDTSLSTDIKTKEGKILHYIQSNSTVLEFGPAYGRMTKFMKENLNCKVYIVENDKDAYDCAVKYATKGICGDINEFSWLKKFGGITFDHIIFANVLEYLLDPWEVLEKSLSLLKDDGSVLLSVPNIAHNAVLINLLNNKFEYTNIGLLDKRHIRFFTHSSLIEMLDDCSLVPVIEDGTVCIPENTEFKNSVNDIIGRTEILEQREYANIYQFVFKCIRKQYYISNKKSYKIQKLYGNTASPYLCRIYFDTGKDFNSHESINIPFYIKNNHFEVMAATNPDCKSVRFDPFEGYACILNNLQIITDNGAICYTYTNGAEIDGIFIFDNLDPQIVIDFKGKTNSKIKISGDIYRYNFDDISLISKGKNIFKKYFEIKSENNRLVTERDNLTAERDNLAAERDNLAAERDNLAAERDNLAAERDNLTAERNALAAEKEKLINSRSWRITKPLRKLTVFVRKHKTLRLFAKGLLYIKRHGIKETVKKIKANKKDKSFYLQKNIFLTKSERIFQNNTEFPRKIKISIITPLYNTPERFLREMIDSCLAQTYCNWELCLADGSDENHKNVRRICKSYSSKDKRIKYQKLDRNFGISGNSNKAIEMSCGEYIGLLDHDDVLHPSALYMVMKAICNEEADFIYTDEATFNNDDNLITVRHYKPDYAIDTLRSCNYICHFSVFSRKLMDQAGKFRSEFDGSQDYDLILRYTDIASKICHIPQLLYFWRSHGNSVASDINNKLYAITAAEKALNIHFERCGISAYAKCQNGLPGFYRIKFDLIEKPLVSIIIPNKDHASLLRNCIISIMEKTTYNNYEIIIVENNSTEDTTFIYYKELKKYSNIHIVYWEGIGFNHSELNNFGIQYANGTHLILLNNDIEIITPNWIEEMLMYSQRKDVGAVGIKLYYPNDTIQHAGVALGILGLAGHIYPGYSRNEVGFMGRLTIVQNMSAVTAACMMIKKSVFKEVGNFSLELRTSFNDVDLCLKIHKKGYLIVWTPFAEAYHHESKTRGYLDNPDNKHEHTIAVEIFNAKWGKELAAGDPYYNCNYSLDRADYFPK